MEEKDSNELNKETRARGVKRNSENKIAEVTTSKMKTAKKAAAEVPEEPDVAQNLFQAPYERTEEDEKRSRLKEAAKDVAEGNLTLEELTKAIYNACTDHNIRLATQGAFYNPPDQPKLYRFDMEAFQRSAAAIARNRERTAALIRAAKLLPSANNNTCISNSSVEGLVPSFPIAEPQLLATFLL
jgi:hypothetical protein